MSVANLDSRGTGAQEQVIFERFLNRSGGLRVVTFYVCLADFKETVDLAARLDGISRKVEAFLYLGFVVAKS